MIMHILNTHQRVSRYLANNTNIDNTLQKHIAVIYERYYTPQTQTFDYKGFAGSEDYQTYRLMLSGLETFDLSRYTTDNAKMSFWLNIYNMLSIHLVIELAIEQRIDEKKGFFSKYGYTINRKNFCLDDIEHGILRANKKGYSRLQKPFKTNDLRLALTCKKPDPKIHFGLYSANLSSPTLRLFNEKNIHQQLIDNTKRYLKTHCRFDFNTAKIDLPKIFKWYEGDFGNINNIIDFIVLHRDDEQIKSNMSTYKNNIEFEYLDFKWNLNRTKNQH